RSSRAGGAGAGSERCASRKNDPVRRDDAKRRTMGVTDAPVSLEDYAFVSAAVSDGLPPEDALAHRGVDPNAWARAELYWLDRLIDDVASGTGELTLALGELSARARTHWARPVPPLDDDLRSW